LILDSLSSKGSCRIVSVSSSGTAGKGDGCEGCGSESEGSGGDGCRGDGCEGDGYEGDEYEGAGDGTVIDEAGVDPVAEELA
jgi:hypothetical protein